MSDERIRREGASWSQETTITEARSRRAMFPTRTPMLILSRASAATQVNAPAAMVEAGRRNIRDKVKHTTQAPAKVEATAAEARSTFMQKRRGDAEAAHEDLVNNAHKALEMKEKAGPQANIPEHQTSHGSKIKGPQLGMTDRDAGSQGSHQPQLKRSQVARSGDS